MNNEKTNYERNEEKKKYKLEKKIRKWNYSKSKNYSKTSQFEKKNDDHRKPHQESKKIKSLNKFKQKFENKQKTLSKTKSIEDPPFKTKENIFKDIGHINSQSEEKFISQINGILFGLKKKSPLSTKDPIFDSGIAKNFENVCINQKKTVNSETISQKELINHLKNLFHDSDYLC